MLVRKAPNCLSSRSRLKKVLLAPLLGAAAFVLLPNEALAQTLWTGGAGDWNVGSNWSDGVPTAATPRRPTTAARPPAPAPPK
jgi:hypothetical protein